MHRDGPVGGAQKQVQHTQGEPEGQLEGLRLWWFRVEEEVVFEPASCRLRSGRDTRGAGPAVGRHVGVDDGERLGDGGGGAGCQTDGTEDVDVLIPGEAAAEVVDAEHGGCFLDDGDGVAQRNVAVLVAGVRGLDACERQQGVRVTSEAGDQWPESGQG